MGHLLFISGPEILVIVLVALLLFGADKMPELFRGIGKGLREVRKAADDIRHEFESSTREIRKDINEVSEDIKKDLNG